MKKVSIITPCFNSSNYIFRLLDSVIQQTYPNIEMFIINDGSTDNSEEVVISYISKFKNKGYTLTCINQKNQGQGFAVNKGLKYITGEYLIWPDSDDFFASPFAIEKMVNVLDNNDEYSIVRSYANILDEINLNVINELGGKKHLNNKTDYLFEDCLFTQNNFWFGAGMYMLRTPLLFQNYHDRNYYVSNQYGGQNWQLLLPLLYKKKCYTIEEHLFNVLNRANSHSRGRFKSIEDQIKKYKEHRKILFETLDRIQNMSNIERQEYKRLIYIKYEKKLIYLLARKNKKEAVKNLKLLQKEYGVRLTLREALLFFYQGVSHELCK
ncbi:MAG: glycosyltransferase family A protein [Tissierellia bacterium]|nr:glycosyltransferase family A protein [Tissierellia bacterium]